MQGKGERSPGDIFIIPSRGGVITLLTPSLPPAKEAEVSGNADVTSSLQECEFSYLPGELQSRICKWLFDVDPDGLSTIFRTCRAIHTLWRQDFLKRYATAIEQQVGALSDLRKRRVMVWRAFGHETLPDGIIALLGYLTFHDTSRSRRWFDRLPRLLCKELSLSCLEDEQQFLPNIISKYPPFLTKLKIQSRHMTDAHLEEIATRCPRLTQLELMDCQGVRFSGTCTWNALTSLAFMDCPGIYNKESFKNIVGRCPQLTGFAMIASSNQGVITRAELMAIADGKAPRIERIGLPCCRDIDEKVLAALIKKCPSIRHITLNGCGLPTLRNSISLLLDFPTLSLLCIRDSKGDMSMHHLLRELPMRIIPELAWAFVVMGLGDMNFVEALVLYACEMRAHFSQEECAKLAWACKRWDLKWPFPVEKQAIDKQNGPEEDGQAARKRAEEMLTMLLERLPKET